VVRNRDSNFEREIAVFSYPQAGVVAGTQRMWLGILQNTNLIKDLEVSASNLPPHF
jgi:hypothetical protein